LFKQIEETPCRTPPLAGLREIAPRKEDHIRERGMMTDDLCVLRRNQPIDSRTRITRAQFYQHRDRVNNVAECGRLDQQNARELDGLQIRPWLVLDLCCFGMVIQFAKLSHQGRLGRVRHSVRAEGIPCGGQRTARPTDILRRLLLAR
jgi:hypothetical protein